MEPTSPRGCPATDPHLSERRIPASVAASNPDGAPAAHDAIRRRVTRLSWAAGIWALWYAIYRGYYAAGGTAFLPGRIRPSAVDQFRLINLAGAVIIGIAALLPVAALPLWSRRRGRRLMLAVCWLVAVGCCMHALVDITQRALSLAGVVHVEYPSLWMSLDHRTADLQDLFFNEPWFLLEGLAFGALGWIALRPGRARRWWTATALTAVVALLLLGMLTVAGLTGRMTVL
jgi:hypothetical protein